MKKKIIIIVFLVIILFCIVRLYIDNYVIQITEMEMSSEKIPDSFNGFKILQISDFHSREFGKGNTQLIKKIDKIKPDIVALTGDMVTGNDTDFTVFFELVENITDKYKVYFIPGNHELFLNDELKKQFYKYLEENGVVFLDNEKIELVSDGESINLYGLWYNKAYYKVKELTSEVIEQSIGDAERIKYNILLTHQPKYFELYQKWGADLILSGHVHGGMVRVPFLGGIFSPDGGIFPKYSEGQYMLENTTLIVSRGVGIGARGFRVFNRPELVVITLKTV